MLLRKAKNIDFHDKQRARRFMYSPLTFIVFAGFIIMSAWNTWDMYQKSHKTAVLLEKTKEAYSDLENREAFLDSKIESLSTDVGVEAEIRDRFGVAKVDEEVIVILSDEKDTPLSNESQSIWSRMKGWFSWGSGDYVKQR